MIVYHIDRDQTLKVGQEIKLKTFNLPECNIEHRMFPQGFSQHGLHYINEGFQHNSGNKAEFYVLEYELELIRRCFFPERPSRYQSLFACMDFEQLKKWLYIADSQSIVWELEVNDNAVTELDSSLLIPALGYKSDDSGIKTLHFSPESSFVKSYSYWAGERSVNPCNELVISLSQYPVRVKKMIGTIQTLKEKGII